MRAKPVLCPPFDWDRVNQIDYIGVAARQSDGLWTLGDPEQAPGIIDAYRGACDDAGKEPGEIILQAGF